MFARRVAAVLAVLIGALGCAAGAAQAKPLRILVTNDDGWVGAGGASTPLIVALRDALARDGHRVTVVAPADDQSGNGTRISFTTPLRVLNPQRDVWTVGGSPADSVMLGLDVGLAGRPDLVVSGINPGGNYSALTSHSGTVGAATTALEGRVPAIAVSIDGTAEQSVARRGEVARYAAELVRALAKRARGGALLPAGIGLNVNYPGAKRVRGASLTALDPRSYMDIGYANTTGALGAPGLYRATPGASKAAPARGSDWHALRQGRISITPIEADLTAGGRAARGLGFLTRVTGPRHGG